MIYGYIRVSTDHQNVINQRHEIILFAKKNGLKIDEWLEEIISSRKTLEERQLGNLLNQLTKEDILITTEISRLGRNMLEVMNILQVCLEKECQIWTLKENYRLGSDIQSKVLAFAFSLSSEIERQLISQRTKNSLQRLKEEGRHLGRPFGFTYRKLVKHHQMIHDLILTGLTKAQIAEVLSCTWNTLQQYMKYTPELMDLYYSLDHTSKEKKRKSKKRKNTSQK